LPLGGVAVYRCDERSASMPASAADGMPAAGKVFFPKFSRAVRTKNTTHTIVQ
jgi:hypothetical protein